LYVRVGSRVGGVWRYSASIPFTAANGNLPRAVTFTASVDHDTLVQNYVLEIYAIGATPGTSAPLATTNLGKPIPTATGEITVDLPAFFQALPPGTYLAAVVAVGQGGIGRSDPVTFSR